MTETGKSPNWLKPPTNLQEPKIPPYEKFAQALKVVETIPFSPMNRGRRAAGEPPSQFRVDLYTYDGAESET